MYVIVFITCSHFWAEKYTKLVLQTANFIAFSYMYLRLHSGKYDHQLRSQKHSAHSINVQKTFNDHREGFTPSEKVHKCSFSQPLIT